MHVFFYSILEQVADSFFFWKLYVNAGVELQLTYLYQCPNAISVIHVPMLLLGILKVHQQQEKCIVHSSDNLAPKVCSTSGGKISHQTCHLQRRLVLQYHADTIQGKLDSRQKKIKEL